MGLSLGSVANALQGIYHQVRTNDDNRTFDTNSAGQLPGYRQNTAPVATPSYTPSTTKTDTSAKDKQLADLVSSNKALEAQIAAQPRLPFYNTSAAYAQAQKTATASVNPVYIDKMNAYIKKQELQRAQQTEQTNFTKGQIDTGLTQTLEDTATGRIRTGEDAATKQAGIDMSEGNYQLNEGTQFDRARTALLGEVANANLTTSGIGAQQEATAVSDRNQASKEQSQQFEAERQATETLKTRTFADIGKSEDRAKGDATSKKAQKDMDLKQFIDMGDLERADEQVKNESERLSAIRSEASNQYKIGVANFIQSLMGSGARDQDVALATQRYSGLY